MTLTDLVGLTFVRASWDAQTSRIFLLDENDVVHMLDPEGDCCAHCYVQHVSGADALIGTVTSVEDIELPPVPDDDVSDVSDVWGHRIKTTTGYCTIEMRLDHNGYYGGWMNVKVVGQVQMPPVTLEDF